MKILVCYDASPVAGRALEKSIRMAKNLDAEMHLFNSIPPLKESTEVFEFIKNKDEEEIERRKKFMAEAEAAVNKTGLSCRTHISNKGKRTGEDIVETAAEIGADYLVIGVRRRSKFEKMVFGSNVQHVVLHSPCPVVTVNE